MVKGNKPAVALLFVTGTFLLGLAWLMPSFPLFAFFGLAPFMAMVSGKPKKGRVGGVVELTLLGLSISLFCATFFDVDRLAVVIIQAMVFGLPFLGIVFLRSLGQQAGIFTIVLFWLALEFIGLKAAPGDTIFLADLLHLKPVWVRWNLATGYLGASLWILLCNAFLCKAWMTGDKFNWLFLILFVLTVTTPMAYSYTLDENALDKAQMVRFYRHNDIQGLPEAYIRNAEWIARTAAWVSVFMVLYSFVRKKTTAR